MVAVAAAVKDEDDVPWWRRGGRSMAAEAFDGDGGGGYGKAMMSRRWKLTSAVVGGNGGLQRLTAAMEDEGGHWHLTVAMVMAGSCGSGGR